MCRPYRRRLEKFVTAGGEKIYESSGQHYKQKQ
jgi:hypothetical protein